MIQYFLFFHFNVSLPPMTCQLPATTPADTEHVPSFAAQLLVVKDAPVSLHPPGYNNTGKDFSLVSL